MIATTPREPQVECFDFTEHVNHALPFPVQLNCVLGYCRFAMIGGRISWSGGPYDGAEIHGSRIRVLIQKVNVVVEEKLFIDIVFDEEGCPEIAEVDLVPTRSILWTIARGAAMGMTLVGAVETFASVVMYAAFGAPFLNPVTSGLTVLAGLAMLAVTRWMWRGGKAP